MRAMIKEDKKRKYLTIVLVMIILGMLAIAYAWFMQRQKVASITKVKSPGDIIVSGVHGSTLDNLNLSYSSQDVTGNKVTVRNVICVDSAQSQYYLEVAHTTNVADLSLKIYPAQEETGKPSSGDYVKDTYNGTDYYYTYNTGTGYATGNDSAGNTLTRLTCVNPGESGLAQSSGTYHNDTYGTDETRVQNQAEPLYWKSSEKITLQPKGSYQNENIKCDFYGYYVLEASWTEQNKETDLVYVMAKYAD